MEFVPEQPCCLKHEFCPIDYESLNCDFVPCNLGPSDMNSFLNYRSLNHEFVPYLVGFFTALIFILISGQTVVSCASHVHAISQVCPINHGPPSMNLSLNHGPFNCEFIP